MNLKKIDLFIFDLDGVIYLGNKPIPGAKEVIDLLAKRGKKSYYLTNNSTRTRKQFQKKLSKMGIQAKENQIITSAYATAKYLQQQNSEAKLFIIGEEGLIKELKNAGFQIVSADSSDKSIDFVIVGLDRYFTYQKLALALTAVNKGAKFIATNDDPTLPTEHGILPGAGSIVTALSTAANKNPMIKIGKPNPFMVKLILKLEKIRPSKVVIVGDRYSTDIKAGKNANIGTILVKTGTGKQELRKIPPSGPNSDFIFNSIADLLKYL